jgi:hypothetical protein
VRERAQKTSNTVRGDDRMQPTSPELHLTFLDARPCFGHWHVRFRVTNFFNGAGHDVITIKALGRNEEEAERLARVFAQAERDDIRISIIAKYQ